MQGPSWVRSQAAWRCLSVVGARSKPSHGPEGAANANGLAGHPMAFSRAGAVSTLLFSWEPSEWIHTHSKPSAPNWEHRRRNWWEKKCIFWDYKIIFNLVKGNQQNWKEHNEELHSSQPQRLCMTTLAIYYLSYLHYSGFLCFAQVWLIKAWQRRAFFCSLGFAVGRENSNMWWDPA